MSEQQPDEHSAGTEDPQPPSGAVSTYREVERKFRVHGLFRVPDLAGAGPVATTQEREVLQLAASYHDTSDLRLAREGVTLRRREGGHDAGWHLKLPVGELGSGARDELRLPLEAGAVGSVPTELRELVTAYTRGAELRVVATLRTERTPLALLDAEGAELAELTDDTVSVVDGERVLVRFRELELEEHAELEPGALDEVVARLGRAGAVPGEFVSKAVRALGPLATAPSDVPEPPEVSPKSPAEVLVRRHLATHVRALRVADLGVRRGEDDAVHQMRVSARRLRSGLRVFRPLLDREWADALRAELGWMAEELGAARDLEVLRERLEAATSWLPDSVEPLAARTLVDTTLTERFDRAREEALEALRSERYTALLDALVAAAAEPKLTEAAAEPCASALPPLVSAAWKRLAKDAKHLHLEGHDDDWHETRKAAKQVRYACDAVAPALGRPAKALAKQVTRVTELLGEHQDAAIAADVLVELAAGPHVSGRAGFALGLMHRDQRDAVHLARVEFGHVWRGVSASRHRAWLRR
ncbi:CHAD domain-containing protein [Motilibacter peucedani]|uniref:CHAD domain-containing protein n=1 Tax=Motilibacter peucedani TaxID=598650 RepID=A0A420XT63_9ACTN|nr:CYTH and CHAD domain-containing protein [Motilibacter peucedani]RKS80016.1 CHAD domain-containing protein [Motilibacter peucedani]